MGETIQAAARRAVQSGWCSTEHRNEFEAHRKDRGSTHIKQKIVAEGMLLPLGSNLF